MRNLADDLDEMNTEKEKTWVRRTRRAHGIRAHEGACWNVYRELGNECRLVATESSASDAIAAAEARAGDGRRSGLGRWTCQVEGRAANGDWVTTPVYVYVQPATEVYDAKEGEPA